MRNVFAAAAGLLLVLQIGLPVAWAQDESRGPRSCSRLFWKTTREIFEGSRAAGHVDIFNPDLQQGRFNLFQQGFYDPNSIYIGVANHKDEGDHHYYLSVGRHYFSAVPPFKKPKIHQFKTDNAALPQGILFQLDVPEEVMKKVEEAILANPDLRTLTCLNAVCRVLADAGIEIGGVKPGALIRVKPVLAGLFDGDIRVDGNQLSPEASQMFATSREQLEHFFNAADTSERRFLTQSSKFGAQRTAILILKPVKVAAGIGAGVAAGGYIVYHILHKVLVEDPEAQPSPEVEQKSLFLRKKSRLTAPEGR